MGNTVDASMAYEIIFDSLTLLELFKVQYILN